MPRGRGRGRGRGTKDPVEEDSKKKDLTRRQASYVDESAIREAVGFTIDVEDTILFRVDLGGTTEDHASRRLPTVPVPQQKAIPRKNGNKEGPIWELPEEYIQHPGHEKAPILKGCVYQPTSDEIEKLRHPVGQNNRVPLKEACCQLLDNLQILLRDERVDGGPCIVCGVSRDSQECHARGDILACSACGIEVHQSCYKLGIDPHPRMSRSQHPAYGTKASGGKEKETKDPPAKKDEEKEIRWRCEPCTELGTLAQCEFCGQSGGAMRCLVWGDDERNRIPKRPKISTHQEACVPGTKEAETHFDPTPIGWIHVGCINRKDVPVVWLPLSEKEGSTDSVPCLKVAEEEGSEDEEPKPKRQRTSRGQGGRGKGQPKAATASASPPEELLLPRRTFPIPPFVTTNGEDFDEVMSVLVPEEGADGNTPKGPARVKIAPGRVTELVTWPGREEANLELDVISPQFSIPERSAVRGWNLMLWKAQVLVNIWTTFCSQVNENPSYLARDPFEMMQDLIRVVEGRSTVQFHQCLGGVPIFERIDGEPFYHADLQEAGQEPPVVEVDVHDWTFLLARVFLHWVRVFHKISAELLKQLLICLQLPQESIVQKTEKKGGPEVPRGEADALLRDCRAVRSLRLREETSAALTKLQTDLIRLNYPREL